MELANKSVLVLGLGITGRSAANYCAARGARVTAADEQPAEKLERLDELDASVSVRVGEALPDAAGFDLVVPSPGVPPARYRDRAQRIAGDVELTFRALQVPIVAITGTNGKSTATHLTALALRGSGLRALAAGNVGEPALGLVGEALDAAVLEVSSFQLETTERFAPRVAVVLNLSPDHLDRHGSFEAYRDAKARILANQGPEDVAVLNADDAEVAALASRARGRVVWFGTRDALPEGASLDADAAVLTAPGGASTRVRLTPGLAGEHNRENALAALAAAWAIGADPVRAAAAIEEFTGLPHRMEEIARVDGVLFVNDSKATNPGAAQRALAGAGAPVVWIAGGRGKGLDFAPLTDVAVGCARAAVLVGEAAGVLKDAIDGRIPSYAAASMEEAVGCAAKLAHPGDVVLLAPACASQDQYRDFAERGERFRDAVMALRRSGR